MSLPTVGSDLWEKAVTATRETPSLRAVERAGRSMHSVRRKTYHRGDLRNALLRAALELVQETGSTHFSLREVTERIGVTKPALYLHFADFDELLSTLCREGFNAFSEVERQVMAKSSDPWARLRALTRAYIHFAISNPGYFRIMFDSGLADRPENIACATGTFQLLVETIQELQGPGEAPFDQAIAVWALMHGLAALMISGRPGTVLSKPDRLARLEASVVGLIQGGLDLVCSAG
jgi:AcrR family transcriptional regulator